MFVFYKIHAANRWNWLLEISSFRIQISITYLFRHCILHRYLICTNERIFVVLIKMNRKWFFCFRTFLSIDWLVNWYWYRIKPFADSFSIILFFCYWCIPLDRIVTVFQFLLYYHWFCMQSRCSEHKTFECFAAYAQRRALYSFGMLIGKLFKVSYTLNSVLKACVVGSAYWILYKSQRFHISSVWKGHLHGIPLNIQCFHHKLHKWNEKFTNVQGKNA